MFNQSVDRIEYFWHERFMAIITHQFNQLALEGDFITRFDQSLFMRKMRFSTFSVLLSGSKVLILFTFVELLSWSCSFSIVSDITHIIAHILHTIPCVKLHNWTLFTVFTSIFCLVLLPKVMFLNSYLSLSLSLLRARFHSLSALFTWAWASGD